MIEIKIIITFKDISEQSVHSVLLADAYDDCHLLAKLSQLAHIAPICPKAHKSSPAPQSRASSWGWQSEGVSHFTTLSV